MKSKVHYKNGQQISEQKGDTLTYYYDNGLACQLPTPIEMGGGGISNLRSTTTISPAATANAPLQSCAGVMSSG